MPEPVAVDLSGPDENPLATDISERLSQELILALVGPVGSGVSTTAKLLKDILSHHFQYKVAPIHKTE